MLLFIVMLLLTCGLPPQQKAKAILQQGIADESLIIQINAAKGLLSTGDKEGLKVLYGILKSDDKNAIAASLTALNDINDTTYSPVIIGMTHHSDPLIRSEAYKLVAFMHGKESYEVLLSGVQDKVAKIRKTSYQGLEKYRDKYALQRGLQDVDPLVRIAAARSLARIGEPGFENFIRNEMRVFNLEIWTEAIIALAEIKDTSAIIFIRDSIALMEEVPMELRLAAAEALLIFNNKEAISVLQEGLGSTNPFERVRTVQILKKHPFNEGIEMLSQVAGDEYINVSVVAIEALGEQRIKKYRELFNRMMDAPNPLVKIAAAVAFLRSL